MSGGPAVGRRPAGAPTTNSTAAAAEQPGPHDIAVEAFDGTERSTRSTISQQGGLFGAAAIGGEFLALGRTFSSLVESLASTAGMAEFFSVIN